jgi:hypothetical protein
MQIPFFAALSRANTVLIAGAGGGFDIASGIPLYLHLAGLGKKAVLANLSFTALSFTDGEEVCPGAYRLTEATTEVNYFPEKFILEWLAERGEHPEMYGFSNDLGVLPLRHAYSYIVERHGVDTLVLVDGGTDSLMTGDETHLGSIVEDSCSIAAAAPLLPGNGFLAAIGFGVEHDLDHYACLENIAALIHDGDYMGASSLTSDMPEGRAWLDLVERLNQKISFHPSIVTNAISSAMQGKFGDFHPTWRTRNSDQFINPLMGLYWFFRLEGVAAKLRYVRQLENTLTMYDVAQACLTCKETTPRRAYRTIPLK